MAGEVDLHGARLDPLSLAGGRAPIELSASQLGANPAQQLAYRERLGHVVVGADLEADDLVDLGVLRRQKDDRDGAPGPDLAADVEAAAPGHHDVEDQEVEAGRFVAELAVGVVTVLGERDVESLLLEGVAHRVAHGGLVVRDQDPAVGHCDHATGVAAGSATGSRIQNVLPTPSSDSTPSRPPITSTIRLAIDRPRPNPSCSSEPEPR